MSKRLQIALSDDAWQSVEALSTEANSGFEVGHITYSDVINEMILCAKVDLKLLQSKHTSVRKSLLMLSAQKGIDLDAAIKALSDLRAKSKRGSRMSSDVEVSG